MNRRDSRFQEPAIVRPQAEGEQPQAQVTITMRDDETDDRLQGNIRMMCERVATLTPAPLAAL